MENNLPYKKNKEWYAVEFGFNNPTPVPYTIDLFNGYNQVPFQTYPNPITPPSSVSSTISTVTNPSGVAFNSLNNTLYVNSGNSNFISVIDVSSNTVITTISTLRASFYIIYNPTFNTMYTSTPNDDVVTVIDCSTNTVSTTITVGDSPFGLAYNPINNCVYVANGIAGTISVINCSSNTVTSTITVGSTPFGIAYNSLYNSMYVSNQSSSNVSVIDCTTNTVTSTFSVTGVLSLITYNTLSNTMYVGDLTSGNVRVINCATNTVTTSISVGNVPFDLSYSELNNVIFVANSGSDDVSVIDCSSNTVTSTVSVGTTPLAIVFIPTFNYLYVANSVSDNVSLMISNTPIVAYISGTTDYNQFVTELNNIPKRARQMRLIVDSANQLSVPLNILKRDANGNFCNAPKIPTEYRDANNYQGLICDMPFEPKELILNNQMIISQYTIAPNSTVKMVLYFDEIDMSDLLSEKLNVYNQIETKVEDLNTISEATLEARYDNRPTIKPEWLKNFKVGKIIKI